MTTFAQRTSSVWITCPNSAGEFQLAQAGNSHRYHDTLLECARIRRELGWPIMVTPFAQLVGTQAVLNVVHGERDVLLPIGAIGSFGVFVATASR